MVIITCEEVVFVAVCVNVLCGAGGGIKTKGNDTHTGHLFVDAMYVDTHIHT